MSLRTLRVEDYGLIASAEIEFSRGATMFTGETGSGKTMILGALQFVFGERAGADVVRRGAARAMVSLTFEPTPALRDALRDAGYESDPNEDASFVREMTQAGKSTLRINGRVSTAALARECAAHIAEFVGQHEAQRLLAPAYHTELLDRFGGETLAAARAQVSEAHAQCAEIEVVLNALLDAQGKAQSELDFAQFAADEIANAAPLPNEDERLLERKRYLDNLERVASALRVAHDALAGEEGDALQALGIAGNALASVASIGTNFQEIAARVRTLQDELSDLATALARQLEDTECDPLEIERVNERLELLDRLKKKYGGSIEAVLAEGDRFRAHIDAVEHRDERRAELMKQRDAAVRQLERAANALTAARTSAATQLATRVNAEFADLALPKGRFAVELKPLATITVEGAETIEFAFSANAGEAMRSLGRVASGGELSRVLLALVLALWQTREASALVFDEIDSGIGGATASAIGVRLGRLAQHHQVVCVTHLAQIAGWAQRHYVLEKREAAGSTTIDVRLADGREARTAELARMLSGKPSEAALAHARTLLNESLIENHV